VTIRQDRIRELIHSHLSSILLIDVTDPALKGVTITDVKLDREIEYADVYVNALGDEDRRGDVLGGLKRANGFLRRELGKRLRIRNIPVLHFHWDHTMAEAAHIEEILSTLDIPPETPTPDDTIEPEDNK